MTSSVEETMHSALTAPSLVALFGKELLHFLMNLTAADFICHEFKSQLLPALDHLIHLPQSWARPALDYRPSNVSEIASLLRARKPIQNYRFASPQRSVPRLVWIATLLSPGHDRMGSQTACLQNGSIDNSPQLLRGQRHLVITEPPLAAYFGISQSLTPLSYSNSPHHQRGSVFFSPLGFLQLALGKKRAAFALDLNP